VKDKIVRIDKVYKSKTYQRVVACVTFESGRQAMAKMGLMRKQPARLFVEYLEDLI